MPQCCKLIKKLLNKLYPEIDYWFGTDQVTSTYQIVKIVAADGDNMKVNATMIQID